MIQLTEPSWISINNIKQKVRFLKPKFQHEKFPEKGTDCVIMQLHTGRLAVFLYNQFEHKDYEGEEANGMKYHSRNYYKVFEDEADLNDNFNC